MSYSVLSVVAFHTDSAPVDNDDVQSSHILMLAQIGGQSDAGSVVLTRERNLGEGAQMRRLPFVGGTLSGIRSSPLSNNDSRIPGPSILCCPNKRYLVVTHSPPHTYFKMCGDLIKVGGNTSLNYS